MGMQTENKRGLKGRAALMGAVLAVVLTAGACVAPPVTTTEGAQIAVSKTTGLNPAGETITITGTGFTTTGNLGTRPPLYNQAGGVYVVFGSFGTNWRPSATGGEREVFTQRWAAPAGSYNTLAGLVGTSELVHLNEDGSFTVELEVKATDGKYDTLAIATYAGSGAVNSGEELLVPLEFSS